MLKDTFLRASVLCTCFRLVLPRKRRKSATKKLRRCTTSSSRQIGLSPAYEFAVATPTITPTAQRTFHPGAFNASLMISARCLIPEGAELRDCFNQKQNSISAADTLETRSLLQTSLRAVSYYFFFFHHTM